MDSPTKSSQVAETVASIKGIPTKEDLVDMLQYNVCDVTFNKLSGDERTMSCTLIARYLPEAKKDEPLSQAKIRSLEGKNVVVWDVNAKAWRSFRYDRVTKVEILPMPDHT